MNRKFILPTILMLSAGALAAHGVQTVRELWDSYPTGQLQGLTNGNTSVGFFPNPAIKWTVNPANPAATNRLMVRSDANVEGWMIGRYDVLESSWTDPGSISWASLGGTNDIFDTASWAVRFLDTPSRINMNANGVYYFSARIIKRSLWWFDAEGGNTNNFGPDDAMLGIGFASGNSGSSTFVGAGFTRSTAANGGAGYLNADGSLDIGDSVYITQGTLGQSGYAGHPSDSGGPYYVRTNGYLQWVTGYLSGYPSMDGRYVNGGFLIGKLTTSSAGSDMLQVYAYVEGETVPTNEVDVVWDATYSFTDSSTLSYLLVWMTATNHDGNSCNIDAIRVGTRYADVIGLETFGPTADPTNRIYEGTPLTLTLTAAMVPDTNLVSYQWLKGGSVITDETNATLLLANPLASDSGNYSAIFSNSFGAVTSAVLAVTVDPYAAPFIVTQPVGGARFQGGPSYTMSVSADGGRPLLYQWKHIVGGVTNVVSGQTSNVLVLTNVQASDGGGYLVTVTNLAGSTNSSTANFQVIVPAAGSFASAVTARGPYAYWMLDETNGTVLHDYWAGLNGIVLDSSAYVTNYTTNGVDITTNIIPVGVHLGQEGIASIGFNSPHYALYAPPAQLRARADLATLPTWSTNGMTLCCWVYTHGYPGGSGWTGTNGVSGQGTKFLLQRDNNDYGGYGNSWGLGFWEHFEDGTTNSYNLMNQLGYRWGGNTENPGLFFVGYTFTNSGLYVPSNQWTFVAWVINGSQTKVYMGTNNTVLTSANYNLASATDTGFPNTEYTNVVNFGRLKLARNGWPYADDDPGDGYGNANVSLSDVAVFYSALSDADIQQLYLAGLSEAITAARSGANVELRWPYGTLQASTNAAGIYTTVPGATSPYLTPMTGPRQFFRVQR